MNNMLISRINQKLQETGKAPQRVSIEATGAKETLRKILDGTTRNPRIDTVTKIAAVLGTTPEWLLGVENLRDIVDQSATAKRSAPELPARQSMPLDVPVLGTAAGSHNGGSFQLTPDPVDYVRRPPALLLAKDIYALFVEGVSMIPQYAPGDLIYINPHKPARFGDPVVVQCRKSEDGYESTIGILSRRTEKVIVLQKHNPQAEIEIDRDTINAMHKILTLNELFGM